MSEQEQLTRWIKTVSDFMSHLSKPQAVVLALWSFGMVIVRSCGLTTVSN
ncbi:MAG: endonuclease, partial [Chloroflexi bacterium]